jgi:hypothetical protein
MPATYEPIYTYTASSNITTIDITSIPSTYDDLILVINLVANDGGTDLYMRFNNDSGTNYYRQAYYASGVTVAGQRGLATASMQMAYAVRGVNSGKTGQIITNIGGYSSTSYATTVLTRGSSVGNATPGAFEVGLVSGVWNNTAVVNRITIGGTSGFSGGVASIGIGSTFTLFGIKGA